MKKDNGDVEKVVVFGYSDNPERYSYKAYHLLQSYGHNAIKFNPREQETKELPLDFDTLTMYVNPAISDKFSDNILSLNFKRIIFNPGSENPGLENLLLKKNVEIIHGCTLVMLKTDQF